VCRAFWWTNTLRRALLLTSRGQEFIAAQKARESPAVEILSNEELKRGSLGRKQRLDFGTDRENLDTASAQSLATMWGRARSWAVAAILVFAAVLIFGLPGVRSAALTDHGVIWIDGDAAFTSANGVTGGEGTVSKPYMIEGWNITATGRDAITILNTTAHFVLRNLTVHSTDEPYAGIRLHQVMNGRLENVLLYDCALALAIESSSSVVITDTNFAENDASAWVSSSTGLTFTRNEFRSGGYMEFTESQWVNVTANVATGHPFRIGTYQYGSGANFNISGNTISEIQTNVFELNGIDGVVVQGNRISATGPGIVVQRSTNVSVYQNIVSRAAWGGIDIGESQHVTVERNLVSNVIPGRGINIAASSDVVVANNDLANNDEGIALRGNKNVTSTANQLVGSGFWIDADTIEEYRSIEATNNTVNGMPFAAYRGCSDLAFDRTSVAQIFLVDCRRVTIRNQTFADLETGVTLINVEDATVDSNVFENSSSDAALRIVWGSKIAIERSNFTRNKGYGIWASYAENLTIFENTIRENYIGIVIEYTTNAWIYHNNFIHSGLRPEEALDRATVGTRWDSGYPEGGNYWSYSYGIDQCSGAQQDMCGLPDGIKDTPVTVVPDGVDRYPLLKPRGLPSVPPVARIDAPDAPTFRLVVTQPMNFNAWRSSDSDGLIVAYEWDFDDSMRAPGDYVTHAWLSGGLFNLTLTVWDNANEMNSTTVRVDVSVPMPVAVLRVQPTGTAYASQRLTFDGGQSRSGWDGGDVGSWDWDFGDGTRASGAVVVHAFSAPGTYAIRLTVSNQFGRTDIADLNLAVSALPDFPLRQYDNRNGFHVPIPSNWSLTEDERIGETTFATVLVGPDHADVSTTILIATDREATVRETNTYLRGIVDGALQAVQEAAPGSFLSEGPTYRSIAGHAGVVFAVTEASNPRLVDKFAFVLSDEHDRFWVLVIVAHADFFFLYNATFNSMVDGFEITLPGASTMLLWSSFAVVIGVAVIVLLIFLIRRNRRTKATTLFPASARTVGRPVVEGHRFCGACGASATLPAHFCWACGTSLTSLPAGPENRE
jgi:parallel beta-helix repeat protein